MTTGEAGKSRTSAALEGIRTSTWSSRLAVALVAVLMIVLGVPAVKEPATFTSQ